MRYLTSRKLLFYNIFALVVIIAGIVSLQNVMNRTPDVGVTDPVIIFACGPMDTNKDGQLTLVDFASFAKVYGDECQVANEPDVLESCGYNDYDKSGEVQLPDFANFAKRYNAESCGTGSTNPEDKVINLTSKNFEFEAIYSGQGPWKYTITGNLPNGCTSAKEKITVSEDKKTADVIVEVVTVTRSDLACTQVIVPIEKTGTINADINAVMTFTVKDVSAGETKTLVVEKNGVKLTSIFDGVDTWNYTIQGQVPNGCTQASAEITDATSTSGAGNKVTASVRYTTLQTLVACTQAFMPYTLTGSYTGNINTQLELVVDGQSRPVDGTKTLEVEKNGVKMTSIFDGTDTWNYKVEGQVPNGCTQASVQLTGVGGVASQLNEITATVRFTTLQTVAACTQAFVPFTLTGSYKGNIDTQLELVVDGQTRPGGDDDVVTLESNGWTLNAAYAQGKWLYIIQGQVSDGCTSAKELINVKDNNNVSINVSVTSLSSSEISCTQVIRQVTLEGSFAASSTASMSFTVNGNIIYGDLQTR